MEITRNQTADFLELRLNGRLDAAWADHVSNAIEEAVRGGSHRIAVDMSSVSYISSLGIGILLKHYNRLKAVQGKFIVVRPSDSTLAVIRSAGLANFLLASDAAPGAAEPEKPSVRLVEDGDVTFEVYTQAPGATFSCALVGDPGKFGAAGFTEADCRALEFPDGSVSVGLGAFGEGFGDCQPRFGEYLALGGAAVTLPTSGEGVPDYVVTQGRLVPQVRALYAIAATGKFAHMARFDVKAGGAGMAGLSQLVDSALRLAGAEAACVAFVAEAASVIGATLRRSPALAASPGQASTSNGSPLEFPAVRDWLSFTTERSAERQLAVIAGVAARTPSADAAPFLRPLAPGSTVHGHFHGIVFPYRPVQRGELTLGPAIVDLLAASTPRTVRHLMADTRQFDSVGETELVRGACWVGPISEIKRA